MLHAAADGFDHACRIPAQNAVLSCGRRMRGADFDVGGIDRHGAHFHQQITFAQFRRGQLNVEQAVFIADRQRAVESDGFHLMLLRLCKRSGHHKIRARVC